MRNGFWVRFWLAVIAAAISGVLVPSVASAGWTDIEPVPGFTGADRPHDLTQMDATDGSKFLYWKRDLGGFETVQGKWVAADGTTGPEFDIVNLSAEDGHDLQVVIAADGEVTVAWIGAGTPNDMVRSVSIEPNESAGPITDISPAGDPGQGIEHLSVAVSDNGTVGYMWRREIMAFGQIQGVTVPDDGPVGTDRIYVTGLPSQKGLETNSYPAIGAMPGDKFKLAWIVYNITTAYWNIVSFDIASDGTPPGSLATYVFDQEIDRKDAGGNIVYNPVTKLPEKDPFGALGDPTNLKMGTGTVKTVTGIVGSGVLVWRQFTDRYELDQDGKPVWVSEQWSAESIKFSETAPPKGKIAALTPNWVNISDIHMRIDRRRLTATWLAERDGVTRTQLVRFSDGGIWDIAVGPELEHVNVSIGLAGVSMLIGWTDEGLLPGDEQVRIKKVGKTGATLDLTLPGVANLKSSSEPLPADGGTSGLDSVTFYGVDQSDASGSWKSSFTDPGIGMTPSKLTFGIGLLNIKNSERRVYVTNPGTTPTQIDSVTLAGADQDSFSIVDSKDCFYNDEKVPELEPLPPGGICEVRLAFSPDDVGPRQANVVVKSEAGERSSELSGDAIARTRVGLNLRPRNLGAKAGKAVTYGAVISNTGGITAENIRVCANAPKRMVSPKKKCQRIAALEVGGSRTIDFRFKLKRNAKAGRQLKVKFHLDAGNANSRMNTATLRVKPR